MQVFDLVLCIGDVAAVIMVRSDGCDYVAKIEHVVIFRCVASFVVAMRELCSCE